MKCTITDMKIVLLGKEFVGKTRLVDRYLNERFTWDMTYQNTIGAAYGAKRVEVNDRVLTLGIWDTAGSETYAAMSRIYYRSARAAVVCYDVTEAKSFQKVEFWVEELIEHEPDCMIYLCGTKMDLLEGDEKVNRQVDYHDVLDYAEKIKAQVFETSSRTGSNVGELFDKIALDFASNSANFDEACSANYRKTSRMSYICLLLLDLILALLTNAATEGEELGTITLHDYCQRRDNKLSAFFKRIC